MQTVESIKAAVLSRINNAPEYLPYRDDEQFDRLGDARDTIILLRAYQKMEAAQAAAEQN